MTTADLKKIVFDDTDDSVDGSVVLGWLNRGYEYLQQFIILPELETTASLTFNASGFADLPGDFMHLVELLVGTTPYREEIDFEERHNYHGPGAFFFWGTQIGVVPAMAGTGTLAYVQQAAPLVADGDSPKLKTVFQPLIAEYAKGLLRDANGNSAKAVGCYTNVDNSIERLQGKLNHRVRRKSTAWGDVRDRYPNYP